MKLFLLLCLSFLSFLGLAQDSAFVSNYRAIRSLVDSGNSFSLYLVPYQSSYLHPIPTSSGYFQDAFHFLRNKKLVRKNPDFKIVVLVDSLVLDQAVQERTKSSGIKDFYEQRQRDSSGAFTSSARYDRTDDSYVTKYFYTLTFNLAVETMNKQTYIFPLAKNEKIVVSSSSNNKNISYDILQRRVEDILLRYKNFYIDRVDW